MLRCFYFSKKDLTQADLDILTAVLKRTMVLTASDRADLAELLKEPWLGSGAGDSSGDEVTSPTITESPSTIA